MKTKILIISISAFVLLILIVGYFRFFHISDEDQEKYETTVQNCLQLKFGMNRDEVRTIMGEPELVKDTEFKGVVYEEWYFYAPLTAAIQPMCKFDKEKGILEGIYCRDR